MVPDGFESMNESERVNAVRFMLLPLTGGPMNSNEISLNGRERPHDETSASNEKTV